MWWVCSLEAFAERRSASPDPAAGILSRRSRIMVWLPAFFVVCWFVSVVVHVMLWNQPLGR
jgi:hypothetical protein